MRSDGTSLPLLWTSFLWPWTGLCRLWTVILLNGSNADLLANLHVVTVRVNGRVQYEKGGQIKSWVHIDHVGAGLWRNFELR
jgi:hypothetical protein